MNEGQRSGYQKNPFRHTCFFQKPPRGCRGQGINSGKRGCNHPNTTRQAVKEMAIMGFLEQNTLGYIQGAGKSRLQELFRKTPTYP
jgi:hypothetical protein